MATKKVKPLKIPGLVGPRIVEEVSVFSEHVLGGEFKGVIQKIKTDDGKIYFRFTYYKDGKWSNRPLNLDADLTKKLIEKARKKGWF